MQFESREKKREIEFTSSVLLSTGELLAVKPQLNQVWKFSVDGLSWKILFGTDEAGSYLDPHDPAQTSLRNPLGVSVKRDDTILVLDSGNHRILELSPKGKVSSCPLAGG